MELGIGELSELTTKVLTGTDHKVFLTNFNLSLLPCKKTKLPTETVAEGMVASPRLFSRCVISGRRNAK